MLVVERTQDPVAAVLVAGGVLSSLVRITLLFSGRMRHDAGAIDHAARW